MLPPPSIVTPSGTSSNRAIVSRVGAAASSTDTGSSHRGRTVERGVDAAGATSRTRSARPSP